MSLMNLQDMIGTGREILFVHSLSADLPLPTERFSGK